MRQVRTKTPSAVSRGDCVAVDAGGSLEDLSSNGFSFILIGWLLLPVYPSIEVFRAVYVHAQQHLRVLSPAILCTLAEKQARFVGIEPRLVWVIRDQVCLSRKLRYPEAVVGIGGEQFQERRCGMSGIAHGDMEFVRGDDAELWIAKFPPKLVPDCDDLHRLCRFRRVLDRVNHPRSR